MVVRRPDVDQLLGIGDAEPTAVVAGRVARARLVAVERQGVVNSELSADDLDRVAPLDLEAQALLRAELEADRLTGRGYHRVRRVARTIADLEGCVDTISVTHVASALALRSDVMSARRWAA